MDRDRSVFPAGGNAEPVCAGCAEAEREIGGAGSIGTSLWTVRSGIFGSDPGEEVVALVVNHDEDGGVLDRNASSRLHAEFRIFKQFGPSDMIPGESSRPASYAGTQRRVG